MHFCKSPRVGLRSRAAQRSYPNPCTSETPDGPSAQPRPKGNTRGKQIWPYCFLIRNLQHVNISVHAFFLPILVEVFLPSASTFQPSSSSSCRARCWRRAEARTGWPALRPWLLLVALSPRPARPGGVLARGRCSPGPGRGPRGRPGSCPGPRPCGLRRGAAWRCLGRLGSMMVRGPHWRRRRRPPIGWRGRGAGPGGWWGSPGGGGRHAAPRCEMPSRPVPPQSLQGSERHCRQRGAPA